MSAVARPEGVVHVHVGQLLERGPELLDLAGVGLGLVAGGVLSLALLLHVEPQVLEQDDRAGSGIGARLLHFLPYAVAEEGDLLSLGGNSIGLIIAQK